MRDIVIPYAQMPYEIVKPPSKGWYVVPQVQLVHQPFRQGVPRLGPGREREHDRDRVRRVLHGAIQEGASQLQEQRRLPRARMPRMSNCSMSSKTFTIGIPGGSGRSP